jgi:hypothetical protein
MHSENDRSPPSSDTCNHDISIRGYPCRCNHRYPIRLERRWSSNQENKYESPV